MVSISPFVNKTFYSRLFTTSLLRQKAQGQLSLIDKVLEVGGQISSCPEVLDVIGEAVVI